MMSTSPFIRKETFFFVNYCYKITVNDFIKNGSFVIGISGNILKHCQTEHINANQLMKTEFTPCIGMRTHWIRFSYFQLD